MKAVLEIEEIAKSSTSPDIASRAAGIVYKYTSDMDAVFSEISRVLKPGGTASFVISDAKINGFEVSIDRMLQGLGRRHELELCDRHARELPESRRYLPPPRGGTNSLDKRMKEEVVLTFVA
jgi:ubiquinone/menaquinone biosynthesis C-methylase UbiE